MKLYFYNDQIYLSIDETKYHPHINMLTIDYNVHVGMKVFVVLNKQTIVMILPYNDDLNQIFNNFVYNKCKFYVSVINDKLIY
jgi:hypothetical protein